MKRILVTALAALGLSACQIPIGPGAPPIFPETPTPVPAVVQPLDLCGPVACVIDSKTGLSYDPRYVKVCPDGAMYEIGVACLPMPTTIAHRR